jgi:glycosyltransferase involved in cell wall biosynthesis
MRLGMSGFFWNRGATGSGQYTHQLVRGLLRLPNGPRCLLFRPQNGEGRERVSDARGEMQERLLGSPVPLTRNLFKVWFEQIALPRACRDEGVDVLHVPYFAPPLVGGSRTVVTIHDLIPLVLPAYRESAWVRLYTRLAAEGARRAAAIVTDSQFSRDDILRLLGVPSSRVHVVYLAADEIFRPVVDASEMEKVRHEYGLPQEYVLYLGGFDQRKNMSTLMAAYAALKEGVSGRAKLVIVGQLPSRDTDFFPDPRRLVQTCGLGDKVLFLGWVPEKDKPALYIGATLFVYPSLYEGFGLPVLEAMSCGTAVITSHATSLPEIVGNAAVLFDPHDVEGLADAITTLLQDPDRREDLAAKGLERARSFSWEKTIAQTIEVYRAVTGK